MFSIGRHKRSRRIADRYAERREALKRIIADPEFDFEERGEAQLRLQQLERA